jgi:hypothetical protein
MIDEVIPIDIRKMKTINDLHTAMCDAAKERGLKMTKSFPEDFFHSSKSNLNEPIIY